MTADNRVRNGLTYGMAAQPKSREHEIFPALNGLRFLAALAIVIFHYAPRVHGYDRVPIFLKNLIDEGPCAVSFFFILSGFVLAHRYLSDGGQFQSAAAFYWARFVRLYPAYLLAFLLFLPTALERSASYAQYGFGGRHAFALSALLSPLMLQAWTPLAQAWNGPSWSLSVEAFFYLVFPWLGFRLIKKSRAWTLVVVLLCWLLPSSFAVAYVAGWIPAQIWRAYVTNNPLLWLPLFIMGICASRFMPSWRKISSKQAKLLTLAALVALILAGLTWPHKWADIFVTGGIAPLLVLVIVCCTHPASWTTRVLGTPSLRQSGEISYAIYILQAPLWHCWQGLLYLQRHSITSASVPFWQFAMFLPFLIAACFAVQKFVEIPLRTMLREWKKKVRASTFQPRHRTAIAIAEAD